MEDRGGLSATGLFEQAASVDSSARTAPRRDLTFRQGHCWSDLLHGEGRVSPATPRNQNNDPPSRGQPQEAVQS